MGQFGLFWGDLSRWESVVFLGFRDTCGAGTSEERLSRYEAGDGTDGIAKKQVARVVVSEYHTDSVGQRWES